MLRLRTAALLACLAAAPLAANETTTPARRPLNPPGYFGLNGVCWFHRSEQTENLARRTELMKELGARWDRSDFWWSDVEPEKGQWDFTKTDRAAAFYRERGLQMFPILNYGAKWREGEAPRDEEQLVEWAAYVRRVVERYRGDYTYWEVWNEPNIIPFWRPQPDAEAYGRLLRVTAAEARGVHPQVRLVAFSTADWDRPFVERAIEVAGIASFDALSYHWYRTRPAEHLILEEILEIELTLARYGKRCPIHLTEMGVTSHFREGISEEAQAAIWMRQVAMAVGSGVDRVYPFTLVDNTDDPGGEWGNLLGMNTLGFRNKPVFTAYRTMIEELGDYERVGAVDFGPETYAFLFRLREGAGSTGAPQHKLVAWSAADVKSVRFPVDVPTPEDHQESTTSQYTAGRGLMGEPVAVELERGEARITLTPQLRYLPVESGWLESNARAGWTPRAVLAFPGSTAASTVTLGFSDATTRLRVEWPAGWTGRSDGTFDIPAHAVPGWYEVPSVIHGAHGAVSKPLHVWVRQPIAAHLRPIVTTATETVNARLLVQNLDRDGGWEWTLTAEPPVSGLPATGGFLEAQTRGGAAALSVDVAFPREVLASITEPTEFTVEARRDGGAGEPVRARALRVAVIGARETSVTIDGNLEEFAGVPRVRVGAADEIVRSEPGSPRDASAEVAVLTVPGGIAIAADVTDAHPMMNREGTGGRVYMGDGVELYLGAAGYGGQYYYDASSPDVHFALTPGDGGEGAAVSDFSGVVTGSDIAVRPRDGGYIIEAFIPAAVLGGRPFQPGDVLGYDVQLNNRDSYVEGAPMTAWMWNGDRMNWLRTGRWGLAVVK